MSLAAMKCFRTIVDPQPAPTSSSSPRNSLSPGSGATPNTSPTKATTQEPRSTSIPSPTPVSKLSPAHGRHLVSFHILIFFSSKTVINFFVCMFVCYVFQHCCIHNYYNWNAFSIGITTWVECNLEKNCTQTHVIT